MSLALLAIAFFPRPVSCAVMFASSHHHLCALHCCHGMLEPVNWTNSHFAMPHCSYEAPRRLLASYYADRHNPASFQSVRLNKRYSRSNGSTLQRCSTIHNIEVSSAHDARSVLLSITVPYKIMRNHDTAAVLIELIHLRYIIYYFWPFVPRFRPTHSSWAACPPALSRTRPWPAC